MFFFKHKKKAEQFPRPFIVGVGRSGTTLLRLMLDAHPVIAIPPETHFIPVLRKEFGRDAFVSAITSQHTWGDFHLAQDAFEKALDKIKPFQVDEGLRCFYRMYGDRYGKQRIGDKSPPYVLHMTHIQDLLPEARFIHIIRDGRDVALSYRGLWFGPGDQVEVAAEFWAQRILSARQQAPLLKHYLEIHFEQLVGDPKGVLKEICDFIEVPFSEHMLTYHHRSEGRLNELTHRYAEDGSIRVAKEDRKALFKLTRKDPDPGRIGRWKTLMSRQEQHLFERVAGPCLKNLGYETRFMDTES